MGALYGSAEAVRYNRRMSELPLYEDPADVPEPRPPAEMRFEHVAVTPYADGRRVKLSFRFPPFLERPSVEAWVTDDQGQAVASLSLIEAMEQDFDFTLHLRSPAPRGAHTLHLRLFYLKHPDQFDDHWVVDEQSVPFTVEPPY